MKVKVCKKCSNVDIKKLEKLCDKHDLKFKEGCISKCDKGQKKSSFGYIDDKFIKVDDEDEFIKKVKKKAKKLKKEK